MLTSATGCLKAVSAYQGKSPHIKEIGFHWDQQPTPRHCLLRCLALRAANRACRLYSAYSGGKGIAQRASAGGISQEFLPASPFRRWLDMLVLPNFLEGKAHAHAPGQTCSKGPNLHVDVK
jgi:hypothetical protein